MKLLLLLCACALALAACEVEQAEVLDSKQSAIVAMCLSWPDEYLLPCLREKCPHGMAVLPSIRKSRSTVRCLEDAKEASPP